MKLPELLRRTGISARQVRYLISEKLIPAPTGGRAHAFYGENHVTAIERYLRLKELGFSPASIKILLNAQSGVPFPMESGITLVVPPDLMASGTPVESLLGPIEKKLRQILQHEKDEHGQETE